MIRRGVLTALARVPVVAAWGKDRPRPGGKRMAALAALVPSSPRSVGHNARAQRETSSPIAARDSAACADLHAVHEVRFGALTARQLNRVSHEESGMLAVHVQAEPMRCGNRVELADDGRRAPCNQCRIGSNLVESVERLGDYAAACFGAFQVLMLPLSRKHRAIDEETVPLLYCAHAPQHRSAGENAQPVPPRNVVAASVAPQRNVLALPVTNHARLLPCSATPRSV